MAMSSQAVRSAANFLPEHFQKVWKATGVSSMGGAILDGDEAVDTITVTGVALGDIVLGVASSADVADLALTASVTAADEVTVQLLNNTGGSITPTAGATYTVVVARVA